MKDLIKRTLLVYSEAAKKFKPYAPVILVSRYGFTVKGREYELLVSGNTPVIDTQQIKIRDLEELSYKNEVTEQMLLEKLAATDEQLFNFDRPRNEIAAAGFKKSLTLLKSGIATDSTRPILQTLRLDDDTMISCNGCTIYTRNTPTGVRACVTKAATELLLKFIDKKIERMSVAVTKEQVLFYVDDLCMSFRLPNGEFLKWRQVLTDDYEISFNIDRKELLAAVDFFARVPYYELIKGKESKVKDDAEVARKRPLIIELDTEQKKLKIYVKDMDAKLVDYTDLYASHAKLDDFRIAFNHRYVINALKALEDNEVEIHMLSPLTPMIIIGVKGRCMVLPIRINNN